MDGVQCTYTRTSSPNLILIFPLLTCRLALAQSCARARARLRCRVIECWISLSRHNAQVCVLQSQGVRMCKDGNLSRRLNFLFSLPALSSGKMELVASDGGGTWCTSGMNCAYNTYVLLNESKSMGSMVRMKKNNTDNN